MDDILNILSKMQKVGRPIALYSNLQDTDQFAVGIVCAVNDEDVLLYAISPNGSYDGYQTIPCTDIYMVCTDGEYEKELERVFSVQQISKPMWHPIETNLRLALLRRAKEKDYVVSLEIGKSGNYDIQGKVTAVSDETVSVDAYDDSGYSGNYIIDIRRISEVVADSSDERMLEEYFKKKKYGSK